MKSDAPRHARGEHGRQPPQVQTDAAGTERSRAARHHRRSVRVLQSQPCRTGESDFQITITLVKNERMCEKY